MAKNTTWDHHLTLFCQGWHCAKDCCKSMATNLSGLFWPLAGTNDCVWQASIETSTMPTLDSKYLALPKTRMIISTFMTSWTRKFNLLDCSIEILCSHNAKPYKFSIEQDHWALLEANCWFIYALTSQQKSYIAKCFSDKTNLLVSWLTSILGCGTKCLNSFSRIT